ncbi:nucleoside triphosphate pyrophosphatase [Methylococcus sp. EFPC2]|uniref:Maf family protein n=1 Tax=Methylococcus sp. EFPC2 TaxID=2812648 RepID=UPI001F0745FE|nr:nucleoside triphosphate pyrophosphatase [Methylococcus sp. EFPC2]
MAKLGLPFEWAAPAVDESPQANELFPALALRLASEKSHALASRYPHHLIIGSDQVATLDNKQLEKPLTRERAIEQLRAASGKSVKFFTSLCVLDSSSGESRLDLDETIVRFRPLSERMIAAYVEREQPYDCAGAFKSEGLGVVLFEKLEMEDPNALVGLPLIRLIRLLESFGVNVLNAGNS